MSISPDPWSSTRLAPPRVSLVPIPPETLHALADGAATGHVSDVALTRFVTGADCQLLWVLRRTQVRQSPGDLPWITRLLVDADHGIAVGVAGFHGPPDESGMVEIGYRVEPIHQRHGYARAALEVLIETARATDGVHVVRATISPDNHPSLALIAQYDFREVGEQWDDEDGLETIYEHAL